MLRSLGFLLLVLFFVLANGFFVASEFSLVATRRSRVKTLAEQGGFRPKLLLRLIDNLNAYISATQLGITLSSLALGWIGEPAISKLLEPLLAPHVSASVLHSLSFGIAFSLITFLHIVFGELAPKTIALEQAEKTALAIALPLEIFYRVFAWPIRALDWSGAKAARLLGFHAASSHGSVYTEDELRLLIETSHLHGQMGDDKKRLISRAFDFNTTEAHEAMIPRSNMTALPLDAPLEDVLKAFKEHGYSRLPIFGDDLDDIQGVLFRQDMEPFWGNSKKLFVMEKLLRPPLFVPTGKPLGSLLRQMQATRTHLVFVMDEYGGIEGMITLEDVLEEIVGEINDEYDEEAHTQIVREGEAYLLDGMLAVRDANRRFHLKLSENEAYTTMAGFLLAQAGRVLEKGESLELETGCFTVESMAGRRIQSIRFTPSPLEQAKERAAHQNDEA